MPLASDGYWEGLWPFRLTLHLNILVAQEMASSGVHLANRNAFPFSLYDRAL